MNRRKFLLESGFVGLLGKGKSRQVYFLLTQVGL
jgi:hypothetical protein